MKEPEPYVATLLLLNASFTFKATVHGNKILHLKIIFSSDSHQGTDVTEKLLYCWFGVLFFNGQVFQLKV